MPAREKPVVVLIPGFMCDEEVWRDQLAALGGTARCIVPSLACGVSLEEMAGNILRSVEGPFSVAGFSLGGYVAQEILRQQPERVERLALIDTSMFEDTPRRIAERRALAVTAALPGAFSGISRKLLISYVYSDNLQNGALVSRVRDMNRRLGREVFLRQNAIMRKSGVDVLKSVRCPTLVLCGREDQVTPVAIHEDIARVVPASTLVVIDNCGHVSPMERPDEVSHTLRQWLSMARNAG